jgi:hypothetical protein
MCDEVLVVTKRAENGGVEVADIKRKKGDGYA